MQYAFRNATYPQRAVRCDSRVQLLAAFTILCTQGTRRSRRRQTIVANKTCVGCKRQTFMFGTTVVMPHSYWVSAPVTVFSCLEFGVVVVVVAKSLLTEMFHPGE